MALKPSCAKFPGFEWSKEHKFCRTFKKLSADADNEKPMTQEECGKLAIASPACKASTGGWYIAMKNFGKPKVAPKPPASKVEDKTKKTDDQKTTDAKKVKEVKPAEPADVYGRCYCCNDKPE